MSYNRSTNKKYKRNNPPTKSKLCRFGSVDFIILASTLAIAISEESDNTDLNILASFFAVLSDELALIASFRECESDPGNIGNVIENANIPNIFVDPTPDIGRYSSNKSSKNHSKKKTTRNKVKKKVKKV
ncbi:MAG: hypothetical protein ACRCXT_14795 [Paraclostridium sp.]